MAVNQDTRHANEHAIYIGCSGSGKTQALKQNVGLRTARHVLYWDIDEDHEATRFTSRGDFGRAVAQAVQSGKPYKLAFSGLDTESNFEWFCRLAWVALDGKREIYVVIEELADVSPSVAKATPEFGRLLRKGRKFGAKILMTSQRGQEIPKTAFNQVAYTYVGQQTGGDIAKVAKERGIPVNELSSLEKLNFFKVTNGAKAPEKIKITPRKSRAKK